MGWFSRRKFTVEDVERISAQAVERALETARAEHKASSTDAMTQALQNLFAKQLESFGQNTAAMGTFLQSIAELSVRRAAVALGSRGGRKRAENAARAKSAQQPENTCGVCRDPAGNHPSAAIVAHVNAGHRARGGPDPDRERLMLEHRDYVRQAGGGQSLN